MAQANQVGGTTLVALVLGSVAAPPCVADTIEAADLPGLWVPSGEYQHETDAQSYNLRIHDDLAAEYVPREVSEERSLICALVEAGDDSFVFVWHCRAEGRLLIVLALGGWQSEAGTRLYGQEYWVGWPGDEEVYGGIPVSYKKMSE